MMMDDDDGISLWFLNSKIKRFSFFLIVKKRKLVYFEKKSK